MVRGEIKKGWNPLSPTMFPIRCTPHIQHISLHFVPCGLQLSLFIISSLEEYVSMKCKARIEEKGEEEEGGDINGSMQIDGF
jgi:hypothetical protein